MSSIGKYRKRLDLDLIARIKAGTAGRKAEPEPATRLKPPRKASTYRGARCNAARGGVWRGAKADYRPVYAKGKSYPYMSKRQRDRYAGVSP